MPINPSPYIQYGGLWTASQQADAKAAGTWPTPPVPKLYAWGRNDAGQLGLGNVTYYSSPKQIGSLTTWLQFSTCYRRTLAIKTDGTLWAWGTNTFGQLGVGNTTSYSSPKQVGALTNWLQVAAGIYSSFAIKTNNTLWAWGRNYQGSLGLGTATGSYSSPVQVGSLTNWLKVASGWYHAAAIKTDGTLWTWGYNAYGALGNGNTTNYSSPIQVGSLTNWSSVTAGFSYYTLALKTDGTLWGWGYNGLGALGTGNTTYYSSPKQIGALTNWYQISSGGNVTLAIKTDNTLWAWGYGANGSLGLGNNLSKSSPNQVGALTNWLYVSASYASAAIKTDGTLWAWGWNAYGQLGLGDTTTRSSPNQVGSLTTWQTVSAYNSNMVAIAKT